MEDKLFNQEYSLLNTLDLKKKQLEIDKLQLEKEELSKIWFKKPAWWSVIIPFIIGIAGVWVAFSTNIFGVQQLQIDKKVLVDSNKWLQREQIASKNIIDSQRNLIFKRSDTLKLLSHTIDSLLHKVPTQLKDDYLVYKHLSNKKDLPEQDRQKYANRAADAKIKYEALITSFEKIDDSLTAIAKSNSKISDNIQAKWLMKTLWGLTFNIEFYDEGGGLRFLSNGKLEFNNEINEGDYWFINNHNLTILLKGIKRTAYLDRLHPTFIKGRGVDKNGKSFLWEMYPDI